MYVRGHLTNLVLAAVLHPDVVQFGVREWGQPKAYEPKFAAISMGDTVGIIRNATEVTFHGRQRGDKDRYLHWFTERSKTSSEYDWKPNLTTRLSALFEVENVLERRRGVLELLNAAVCDPKLNPELAEAANPEGDGVRFSAKLGPFAIVIRGRNRG